MRDTIEMAREANVNFTTSEPVFIAMLERFAELVRADERKEMQVECEADKIIIEYHEATIKRLEALILAEREACAKVVDAWSAWHGGTETIAAAIRSRGQK